MVKKRALREAEKVAEESQKEEKNEKVEILLDKKQEENLEEKEIIEKRKERLKRLFHFKSVSLIFLLGLFIALIYTFNIRTSNIPGLRDVTTGNYTLGPDLDPFLFLRWARYIVEHGSLMQHDTMRYFPLGYDTSKETILVPYMMAYLYKILHFFDSSVSVEFAAMLYPVIFFLFATIAFFFFVRRVFIDYPEIKRNIIAFISTLFFVNMPPLLHRTTAGIPEKEAAGIFFVFLSFYLFLVAIQATTRKKALTAGLFSGITTGLLGMTWGGLMFVIFSISIASTIYFFLRSITKENFIAYASWIVGFTFIFNFFTERYGNIFDMVRSTSMFIPFGVLFLLSIDFFITRKIYEKKILVKKLSKITEKIPKVLFSLLASFIIGLILLLLFSPSTIFGFIGNIKDWLLHPIGTDRITLTVAENNQPFFGTWKGTFGIWFFWLFVSGSVLLFYEAIQKLKKIEGYILSGVFAVFLISLIFSRYSPNTQMNGTSQLSQLVYFGGFALFGLSFGAIYFIAYKSGETEKFKHIKKEIILLLVMFFIAVVSARGAIRLFFLLAPMTAILSTFITVDISERALRGKNELVRLAFWITLILAIMIFYIFSFSRAIVVSIFIIATLARIVVAFIKSENNIIKIATWIMAVFIIITIMIPSFVSFSRATASEAQGTRPGYYQIQWQKAMAWVRNNTPRDAVFSHWWDYGYWIQTLGERATFLDGGNAHGYWNYQMGRYVLTGKNETEALEVLKAHNVSYLLIDSTDIGKYPAYSSIGSDLEYDRYNWVPTFQLDERQIRETRNETLLWYQGGVLFSRDFIWYDKNTKQQYLFPAGSRDAIIAGVILPVKEFETGLFNLTVAKQARALIVYKGNTRIEIPMCYLYFRRFYDFRNNGPCLPSALYILSRIMQASSGVSINNVGTALFLNQKAVDTLWVKLYLFNQSENFELVHVEPNMIISQLNQQGLNLPEFSYFGQVLGPIKIWKVNYPKDIAFKQEYLNTTYPDPRLTIPR
jgi:asparagine N-glycosylation enzyme membrane subunit Stt3